MSLAPFYTLFQILVTKVTIAMVVTCNIISDLWNKQFRVATYRAKYAPTVLCNQISLLGDKKTSHSMDIVDLMKILFSALMRLFQLRVKHFTQNTPAACMMGVCNITVKKFPFI